MSLEGKTNAWIKPSGQFIAVGYMRHDAWAREYLQERGVEFKGYPYQALHKRGWIRLLTWIDGSTKALGDCISSDGRLDTMKPALTPQQKETLQEWCMDNSFKYKKLFDTK